jgi:SAM-dependent MidA family methyltransferase
MSTVRQALQSALDENGGTIPFDAFMGIALHHPQDGYYTRNSRGIGTRGDFTTVPQLGPALGAAIGRWLRKEAGRRGWRRFHINECGPGSGALASSVMKSFGWLGKRKVDLHLVDESGPLREAQAKTLAGFQPSWHATIGDALASCDGRALIYHNEFFDAFPCRVFRRERDGWTELHLHVADGKLREDFTRPARPLPDSAVFHRAWPEGQRIEVFESVATWIRDTARSWKAGAMLVIDYGGRTDEIYHRRPAGTLRAYRGHERLTGDAVFELPGRQDLTADVNFDDLASWGRGAGWSVETSRGPVLPEGPAQAFRQLVFGAGGEDRR